MTERMDSPKRRQQIAEAALSLAAGHGVAAVTVARVARLVGLAPSALYRHYSGKDELMLEVIELVSSRLNGLAEAALTESGPAPNRLKSLLRRHVRLALELKAVPQILFSDHVFVRHGPSRLSLYAGLSRYLRTVGSIVSQGQAEGTIRSDYRAHDMAVAFLGLFQPPAILHHLSGGEFDLVNQAERSWRIFSDWMTSRSAGANE